MGQSWQCPFCGRHATIGAGDKDVNEQHLHSDTKYGTVGIGYWMVRCPNVDCKEVFLSLTFEERTHNAQGRIRRHPLQKWQLLPESNAKPQPEFIPAPIREDYFEACLIRDKSPKASATLARRCLQGMIRDFWKIKKGRLIDEIDALKEQIDTEVWEAIDAVRRVGNIGAHMEKDIDLIIEVDPDEAGLLIELVEQLFDEWYVKREQRNDRMSKLKVMAAAKATQKKGEAQPAPPEEDSTGE